VTRTVPSGSVSSTGRAVVDPLEVDPLAGPDRAIEEGPLDELREVLVRRGLGQREGDAVGVLDVFGADGDGVADVHAGVAPGVCVDPDDAVLAAGPDLRDGLPVALDDDRLAAEDAERAAGRVREAGDAAPGVALLGALDGEVDPACHTCRSGRADFTPPAE
jgi:hypothetical protein